MTAYYHCDGPDCARQMLRSEPRIAIVYEKGQKPPTVIEPDEHGDMPQIEIDTEVTFYMDGDLHFCSNQCMTAYGYAKHIEETT